MTTAKQLVGLLGIMLVAGCSAGDNVDVANSDELSDAEDGIGEVAQAAATIRISCPRDTRATWIQALNGTVDLIAGQTGSFGIPGGASTTTLKCLYGPSASPQILDHTVQFAPGTVPSACGARATFSGTGQQIGGVPPFGGWQFKSKRVDGIPTYNERTGSCRIQLPVVQPPTMLERKVTQPCTPIQGGYSCPVTTLPL